MMVPMRKKPTHGDYESSLKISIAKLFLARCPCASYRERDRDIYLFEQALIRRNPYSYQDRSVYN